MPSLRTPHLLILWGGLTAGVIATVIYPQSRTNAAFENQLHDLELMMDETDAVIEQINVLSDWTVRVRSIVESSTRPIPLESDVSGFVRDMSLEMGEMGIVSREIITSNSVETEHARVLPITISMTTTFPSVVSVIGWVENLPRLVRIRRVKISTGRGARMPDGQVSAEILLDAYFEPTEFDVSQNLTEVIAARLGDDR
ncbi:MAG: type 4a pilus biogenesis protein PilO [Planctomycetota bacterium]|jgi:Tfp pilus assembly protein PilO